jgi:tyrosinase
MDRVWWSWQSRDLSTRLDDVSGSLVAMDYNNLQAGNATLDTVMQFESLAAAIKVRDVMNVQGDYLCYKYDTLY